MTTHKPFRELISPNSNFEFMGTRRRWITISIIACLASVGMLFVNKAWRGDILNWSIDFKGGTEIIVQFNQAGTKTPAQFEAGQVRDAVKNDASLTDFGEFTVSAFAMSVEVPGKPKPVEINGFKMSTRAFGALSEESKTQTADEFVKDFTDKQIVRTAWSGDTLSVISKVPLAWDSAHQFFLKNNHVEIRQWNADDVATAGTQQEGTGEYKSEFHLRGMDTKVEAALKSNLKNVDVVVLQTYAVGAAAGERLRNDGIKSLFYALGFIMLYLLVRFDIRYAPGAIIALIHDAVLVVGGFAFTWTEFSLTTVAAILTVTGYSVNDTVIIFDRIRENTHKLKDKKFIRIINTSLNEVLGRSILTSSTLFAVTLAMNLLGTGVVRDFAFAMNIGVVTGTYSSIFIASPVALWIDEKYYSASAPRRPVRPSSRPTVDEPDAEEV